MRPKPLLAHWVPGLAFVAIVVLTLRPGPQGTLVSLFKVYGRLGIGVGLGILSYVVGQVFDALRDVCDCAIDMWEEVNWHFFVTANPRHIEKLEDWFFTYYILNFNLALCLAALNFVPWIRLAVWEHCVSIVVAALFALDAYILRKHLAELTNELTPAHISKQTV